MILWSSTVDNLLIINVILLYEPFIKFHSDNRRSTIKYIAYKTYKFFSYSIRVHYTQAIFDRITHTRVKFFYFSYDKEAFINDGLHSWQMTWDFCNILFKLLFLSMIISAWSYQISQYKTMHLFWAFWLSSSSNLHIWTRKEKFSYLGLIKGMRGNFDFFFLGKISIYF